MASVNDLFGGLDFGGGGILGVIISIFIGLLALSIVIGIAWFFIKKKRNWNIRVEFKIPRDIRQDDEGNVKGTISKEWGIGHYDSRRGVVFIKRKKRKAVPMKPFDIKRYLSAESILTVIQVGIEDYRPVLDESYLEVIDDETGEEGALLRAHIDTSEGKSWRSSFERDSKSTYTISSFLSMHGDKLIWGLVLLIVLIGQAIVIGKLS